MLLLVVVVAVPFSWLTTELKAAREQMAALNALGQLVTCWSVPVAGSGCDRVLEERGLSGCDRVLEERGLTGSNVSIPYPPPEPQWLRTLLGDDFFTTVDMIFIPPDSGVSNESFAGIGRLTELKTIRLDGADIDDDGLDQFKALPHLKLLILKRTRVTDAGVKKLQQALPNCYVFQQ